MGQHDSSYRKLFAHARMVCDFLRVILGEAWVQCIDLASAEMVNTAFAGHALKIRHSDTIWKFRRRDRDEPVFVYVMLEFQSRPDPFMAVRVMTYIGLFYETLIASGHLSPSGKLPLVIPIVIYNGTGAWGAALELSELIERLDPSAEQYVPRVPYRVVHEAEVPRELLQASDSPVAQLFLLERSENWQDVEYGVAQLRAHVAPTEASLRRAITGWVTGVLLPRLGLEATAERTLEEVETMLAERIDEWNRKLRQEGLQEGRQEGRQEGESKLLLRLLERKFGALAPEIRERVRAAESSALIEEWFDRAVTATSLRDIFGADPS